MLKQSGAVEEVDLTAFPLVANSEPMRRTAHSLPPDMDASLRHDILCGFEDMLGGTKASEDALEWRFTYRAEQHCDPVSATVVRLGVSEDWNDPFLAMLDETYLGTNRSDVTASETRKMSLVKFDDQVSLTQP